MADTAKLLASLTLDDRMTPGLKRAGDALGQLEGKGTHTGTVLKAVLGVGVGAVAVKAASMLVSGVQSGIDSLRELDRASAQVEGALDNVGMAGRVTAGQVADWASRIEESVGFAFDDKDILAASAGLIRYGKVSAESLEPAMEVMTDMAARTGGLGKASKALAKALADPARASGTLRAAGVTLTDQQEAQIRALAKSGRTAEAQRAVLDALAETTRGAARATRSAADVAYGGWDDAMEDLQRELARGLMPVLTDWANFVRGELAKPETIAMVRRLGQGIASAGRGAIDFAKRVPWGAIASALDIAAGAASRVVGMFAALPPWVQTAVVTGWGLNKVSGGAVAGLLGGAGKGIAGGIADALGKSFLSRGGTPANPLFVADVAGGAGVPGAGGAAPAGGAAGGLAGKLKFAAGTAVSGVALVGAMAAAWNDHILPGIQAQADRNNEGAAGLIKSGSSADLVRAIRGLEEMPSKLEASDRLLYELNASGIKSHTEAMVAELRAALERRQGVELPEDRSQRERIGPALDRVAAAGEAARGIAAKAGGVAAQTLRAQQAGAASLATIARKDFSPRITVPVTVTSQVSLTAVVRGADTIAKYGRTFTTTRAPVGAVRPL